MEGTLGENIERKISQCKAARTGHSGQCRAVQSSAGRSVLSSYHHNITPWRADLLPMMRWLRGTTWTYSVVILFIQLSLILLIFQYKEVSYMISLPEKVNFLVLDK